MPGSLGLIIAVFEGPAQAKAIGSWTAWTSVSSLFGPVLGGLLVDGLGWRSVFVIGLVPAAASMLLLGRVRDEAREGPAPRIDLPSAALAAVGLGLLTVGLIEVGGGPRRRAAPGLGDRPAGRRARRPGRLHRPRPPRGAPARAAGALPDAELQRRQPRDLLHLRGLGIGFLVPGLYLQQVLRLPATTAALVGLPRPCC